MMTGSSDVSYPSEIDDGVSKKFLGLNIPEYVECF